MSHTEWKNTFCQNQCFRPCSQQSPFLMNFICKSRQLLLLGFIILLCNNIIAQTVTIIPAGDTWKYLDNGSDQVIAWTTPSYNDSNWAQGNAELGYGDNDEATVVSFGSNINNPYITTYFRKSFTVNNPSVFTTLNLSLLRDDGAVIYINGIEVWRDNMPSGNINYLTAAASAIAWPNETTWHPLVLSPLYLLPGTNVIAVEIHQSGTTSSDLSFNLKLEGNTATQNIVLERGPYLQTATANSIIIKWRTDIATDSKIRYGTTLGNLNQLATDPYLKTDHEVHITGLNPATIYYYTIETNSSILMDEAADMYFKTSPATGTIAPYRFWVIGDAGMGNNDQRAVRDGFINYNNHQHIDGWIMLGDNAYGNGTNDGNQTCYQTGVFQNMYENVLKNTVLWPAPGNHDYNNHIPFSPAPAYYDIFTLPANAEAGGIPSGTEKYYSYNYGNIHFIVLDSYDESRAANGAMAQWLQNDLANNTMMWTVAYWHHPPYTKGNHDSDNSNMLNGELVEMRENILPIIEAGGVDLVLNGHSHCYERSFLLDGHYGYSNQLQHSMILDSTSGCYPVGCAYQKRIDINKAHKGTVYSVVGCSGKLSGTSSGWPHPVMYKATNTDLGSMLLEINGNRLDAKFILTNDSVYDSFTIMKNAGEKKSINSCAAEQIVLHPSWSGTAQWTPGGIIQDSLIIAPLNSEVYIAANPQICVNDTFMINVIANPACTVGVANKYLSNVRLNVFPSFINNDESFTINITTDIFRSFNLTLIDVLGNICFLQKVECKQQENQLHIPIDNFKSGIYFIQINDGEDIKQTQKVHILKN